MVFNTKISMHCFGSQLYLQYKTIKVEQQSLIIHSQKIKICILIKKIENQHKEPQTQTGTKAQFLNC